MDVILLFMKLEDKYWGIFLVSLLVLLFMYFRNKNRENGGRFLKMSIYGLVAYLLFLCPLTYEFIVRFVPLLSDYYELSHMQLMVPVMVLAGVGVWDMSANEGRGRRLGLLAGLCVLLAMAGDFAYVPTWQPEWTAESSAEEKEAFDILLAHAQEHDADGKLRIWGMKEFMAKSRLYSHAFSPIYGKDISEAPENYSQELQSMYQRYEKFDVPDGTAINVGDQLDAVGTMPYLYPGVGCEYVILKDPKYKFDDYEEIFGKDGFDSVSHFSSLGYELIGRTETILLFYKQEG